MFPNTFFYFWACCLIRVARFASYLLASALAGSRVSSCLKSSWIVRFILWLYRTLGVWSRRLLCGRVLWGCLLLLWGPWCSVRLLIRIVVFWGRLVRCSILECWVVVWLSWSVRIIGSRCLLCSRQLLLLDLLLWTWRCRFVCAFILMLVSIRRCIPIFISFCLWTLGAQRRSWEWRWEVFWVVILLLRRHILASRRGWLVLLWACWRILSPILWWRCPVLVRRWRGCFCLNWSRRVCHLVVFLYRVRVFLVLVWVVIPILLFWWSWWVFLRPVQPICPPYLLNQYYLNKD